MEETGKALWAETPPASKGWSVLFKSPYDFKAPSPIFHPNAGPASAFLLPKEGNSFTLKGQRSSQESPNSKKGLS